jgi:hypothetical protein
MAGARDTTLAEASALAALQLTGGKYLRTEQERIPISDPLAANGPPPVGREWPANGRQRPDLVLVDYKPVARYIQDAMLAGKCQLYVDGIPTRARRREDEGGAAHTGLPREAVVVIDGMGEGAGAM